MIVGVIALAGWLFFAPSTQDGKVVARSRLKASNQ